MSFSAGICTKCEEYILLKDGVPFLVCPMCGATVGYREATEVLGKKCADAKQVHEVVADCIVLEAAYGPELPFMILADVCDNFPRMEEPAYMLVRLSAYNAMVVKTYLESFADIKSDARNIPWAEEFLDAVVTYRNMEMADLLIRFIENKVKDEKKKEYLDKVNGLRKEYVSRAADPKSTKLLFALYITASVLNILALPIFMLIPWGILPCFSCSVVLVCIQMGFMFWHNKAFGNRLSITPRERLFMVIFMCSMFFALGSGVIGGIYKILG
jgi:predicted RNA-binding Zn-ribbon protein involved in translation (DUF1610 family)